ncbi:hypothetical protein CDAR_378681 [Caerostris darwini]|uniref:Uncharacterized protein n=1 Tax=Caerostris darwini TaxID=1538125 RepID=A0AAV4MTE3_9ARAC|nr:hypothetical protein CDAR_378681 [Caerostris darwini]
MVCCRQEHLFIVSWQSSKEAAEEKRKRFLGNVNRVRGVIFPNAVLISVHAARPLGLTSDSSERLMVARLINCITPLLDTVFPRRCATALSPAPLAKRRQE